MKLLYTICFKCQVFYGYESTNWLLIYKLVFQNSFYSSNSSGRRLFFDDLKMA